MNRYLWLLAAFMALVVLLAVGLRHNPSEIPSVLIGKPAPLFTLPQLHEPDKTFASQQMQGQVWLLNVWASWCPSCRDEHPVLVEFSKQGIVPLIGLDYKDQREDALKWLERFGDPYRLSVVDIEGRVGIDFGVYGAPETFVIDKKGLIRYKQIGPVTPQVLNETLLPLIEQLQKEAN